MPKLKWPIFTYKDFFFIFFYEFKTWFIHRSKFNMGCNIRVTSRSKVILTPSCLPLFGAFKCSRKWTCYWTQNYVWITLKPFPGRALPRISLAREIPKGTGTINGKSIALSHIIRASLTWKRKDTVRQKSIVFSRFIKQKSTDLILCSVVSLSVLK